MVDPERFAAGLAEVRARATALGRPAPAGALFCWSNVGADGAVARRDALATLAATYRQDFTPLADRYVPAGTPETVAARLREFGEAGVETVLFAPACPDDRLDAAVETFAREVAPALREVPC
jgi:alkanesulfonate monooxygenase SsuD/methylene tetrahydromethanopterin reductase-like flavin-dependent oxidoreductase (luciferase family)